MGQFIVPLNKPSQFFGQDGQWFNKMKQYIVPLDRPFQLFNQDGQWFSQIEHPNMSLHVCKHNCSYN